MLLFTDSETTHVTILNGNKAKNINNEDKEIESIPTVSAMKTKENTRMVKANLKKTR